MAEAGATRQAPQEPLFERGLRFEEVEIDLDGRRRDPRPIRTPPRLLRDVLLDRCRSALLDVRGLGLGDRSRGLIGELHVSDHGMATCFTSADNQLRSST